MKGILDSLNTYLSSLGYGTPGQSLFVDTMPGTPYAAVSVFSWGGIRVAGDPVRRFSYQVRVRNPNGGSALTTATSLYRSFDNKWCVLSPTYQGHFRCLTEIGPKRVDENGHSVYTFVVQYTAANA